MTILEFEQLRDLPDKTLYGDITFSRGRNPDVFEAECRIDNQLGFELILNVKYNDLVPSVVFNFRVTTNGAICRYCVNGASHPDRRTGEQSRTHKHTPESDLCFRQNLPKAKKRDDLSITSFDDVEKVWATIRDEAKIVHQGKVVRT